MAASPPYNPAAYVPGGSSPAVARAIVAAGSRPPGPRQPPPAPVVTRTGPPPVRPPVRPVVGPAVAPPLTDVQVAQQQLAPVIAQITAQINARAHQGGQEIVGYTNDLARQLAGTDYASPYSTAVPQQAAVDAALQQSLTGGGNQLAQDLSGKLASIAEPGATNAATGAVQAFGQGTGNTALASGSAALSELIANAAGAGAYGKKQPGIARETGLQALGQLQGQSVNDIATQTAPLEARIPDIVSAIQANRAANVTARQRAQQLAFEQKLAADRFGLDTTKATYQQRYDQARLRIAQQTADVGQQRLLLDQWKAANPRSGASGTKPSSAQTRLHNDGYLYDANSNRVIRNGKPVKVATTGGAAAAKPLTVSQKGRATADAYGIAQNGLAGKDGAGNPAAALNVGQAWAQMKLHGLLSDPRTTAIAIRALIDTYGAAGVKFARRFHLTPAH